MAKEISKPIIEENTKKYKIDSVEFETLTLGSLPPTFQGLLLYPFPKLTSCMLSKSF